VAGNTRVHLAKRGWHVTGVDIVDKAMDPAKQRAAQEDVEVQWVTGDVSSLRELGLEPGPTPLYDSAAFTRKNGAAARPIHGSWTGGKPPCRLFGSRAGRLPDTVSRCRLVDARFSSRVEGGVHVEAPETLGMDEEGAVVGPASPPPRASAPSGSGRPPLSANDRSRDASRRMTRAPESAEPLV